MFGLLLTTLMFKNAYALNSSYPSLENLSERVSVGKLVYRERKVLSNNGFTESCLYSNQSIAVIVHYCGPAEYNVRSLSLIGEDFGMIQIYEEPIKNSATKAIRIKAFAEKMAPYIGNVKPEDITLTMIDNAIKEFLVKVPPRCWSVSQSGAVNTNCYIEKPENHSEWLSVAEKYVLDPSRWNLLFQSLSPIIQKRD